MRFFVSRVCSFTQVYLFFITNELRAIKGNLQVHVTIVNSFPLASIVSDFTVVRNEIYLVEAKPELCLSRLVYDHRNIFQVLPYHIHVAKNGKSEVLKKC